MPTTIAIIGASGVVGRRVLERLLGHADVEQVIALGRRALSRQHEKLTSKVVDLASTESIAAELPDGVSVAISCIGTTMRQAGSKAAFRAVDHDAVLAFARAALARGARRFVLVSSIGADHRSSSFYLQTKGEVERALEALPFTQLTVLRPSFIDDQGTRTDHRLAERIGLPLSRAIFAIVGKTHRYAPITADTIARALVRLALDDETERVRVVESDGLHVLGR